MRFRAEQHLRRPAEIRAVREQGQRLECRAFTLWWRKRTVTADPAAAAAESGPGARVCMIASTAAVGNAVRRNRAKRRLRETFRAGQAAVPPDCDLLLIARRVALGYPAHELSARFAEACRQIGGTPPPSS